MRAILGSKRGFTLIELMVTLGIVALLGVVGASTVMNTSGWLARNRLKSTARELSMNLQFAKMEAIKRNTTVTVTFGVTIGGTTYDYVVFAEGALQRDMEYDPGPDAEPKNVDTVLKQVKFVAPDYRDIRRDLSQGGGTGVSFATNGEGFPAFAFDPRGMPKNGNTLTTAGGTIFLEDIYGNKMRVEVNNAGRISIRDPRT